jgi:hypothetical protein
MRYIALVTFLFVFLFSKCSDGKEVLTCDEEELFSSLKIAYKDSSCSFSLHSSNFNHKNNKGLDTILNDDFFRQKSNYYCKIVTRLLSKLSKQNILLVYFYEASTGWETTDNVYSNLIVTDYEKYYYDIFNDSVLIYPKQSKLKEEFDFYFFNKDSICSGLNNYDNNSGNTLVIKFDIDTTYSVYYDSYIK